MAPKKKKEDKHKIAPEILKQMKDSQEKLCGVFMEIEGWAYDMVCLN